MSVLAIAWRTLRTRPLQTSLTILIIALGVGLAIAVIAISGGARRGLMRAGGPFEIVVGSKGSPTQLVNSSVLLQDTPLNNIAYARYEQLADDPRVQHAIPIAMGDNIAGLRLVGTTPEWFTVTARNRQQPFYQVEKGRAFAADFEAVLGSAAAQRLGLAPGETFVSLHGTSTEFEPHDHSNLPYTVVGILSPTDTPADLGVYVSLSSIWEIHGLHAGEEHTDEAQAGEEHADEPDVTAVLIRAKDISSAYQLYQELNTSNDVQAALPGMVLTQFLVLLGQGQQILTLVSGVALVMAGLSVALTLYNTVANRQREIAVLRALGASRSVILGTTLLEVLLLSLFGIIVGILLGYLAAALVAGIVRQQSAIALTLAPEPVLGIVILALLGIGLLAGVAPAIRAYRIDPATTLA